MKLSKAILKQYGSSGSGGVGSFSEIGFTAGEMQQAQGCTPIPGSDPLINAYRTVAG